MKNDHASLEKVVWSEGILLSPQHLQQQDRYIESLIESRVRSADPFAYGVIDLEFDAHALAAGECRLKRFFGVLPEGMVLNFEDGDSAQPSSRPVDEHVDFSGRAIGVFLGVPRARVGGDNFAADPKVRSRYARTEKEVVDLAGSGKSTNVTVARPRTLLLLGEEAREDIEHIKLAEINKTSAGTFEFVSDFLPPLLRCAASQKLLDETDGLIGAMHAKRNELREAVQHRDSATIDFRSGDLNRFLMLSAIDRFLPTLKHLREYEGASPRELYKTLGELAGQLGTFSPNFALDHIPSYAHADLRQSISPVIALVRGLLRESLKSRCVTLPLAPRDHAFHTGSLDDEAFAALRDEQAARAATFLLAVTSPLSEAEVADLIPKLAKVASQENVHEVLAAASPGVPLEVTFRPPASVPVKSGVVYFDLTKDSPYWDQVLKSRSLAVYLPQPFDAASTRVELLAIPAQ